MVTMEDGTPDRRWLKNRAVETLCGRTTTTTIDYKGQQAPEDFPSWLPGTEWRLLALVRDAASIEPLACDQVLLLLPLVGSSGGSTAKGVAAAAAAALLSIEYLTTVLQLLVASAA